MSFESLNFEFENNLDFYWFVHAISLLGYISFNVFLAFFFPDFVGTWVTAVITFFINFSIYVCRRCIVLIRSYD